MALETLSYSLRKRESRVPVVEVEVESSLLSSSAAALMSSGNVADQMPPAAMNNSLDSSDDEQDNEKGGKKSSRRELPAGAVATLKAWLLSPEHFTHPYPTPQDQAMLMQKTGIDKKQLKNWFTNARRRIWKPMLKKQIEQGTLTATGAGGGGVAVAGVMPGLMVQAMPGAAPPPSGAPENPHSVQAMQAHYQHAVHQQQQTQQPTPSQTVSMDAFGNTIYVQQPQPMSAPDGSNASAAPAPQPVQQQQQQQQQAPQQHQSQQQPPQHQFYTNQFTQSQPQAPAAAPSSMSMHAGALSSGSIATSSSIGSLPFMHVTGEHTLNKTDSHAVLMELFARDQDLVRQAIESARMKTTTPSGQGQQGQQQQQQQQGGQQQPQQVPSQHPMKIPSQSRLATVPTMNSWPHFSSISSLNNLGTMPGVKSIASLSGADLASQGNVNKMGNLAQVKSQESIGKTDSYAFLEVFFGERSSNALNTVFGVKAGDQRGMKRERDEDNDVGLSLEDESPSNVRGDSAGSNEGGGLMQSVLMPTSTTDFIESGTLKRAYDDALAARGLLAVSRSCEKLTDLALPAKIQRTLSQELIRQHQPRPQQQQEQSQSQQYGQYSSYNQQQQQQQQSNEPPNGNQQQPQQSQQYPGQNPGQGASTASQQLNNGNNSSSSNGGSYMSDPSETNASVEVPSATACAICQQTNVDTQLRPCGHMFHERCLKPSLQIPLGPPKCPIDHIPLQSALLAVPTDEKIASPPTQSMSMPSWCAPASSAPKPNNNVSESATSSNAS